MRTLVTWTLGPSLATFLLAAFLLSTCLHTASAMSSTERLDTAKRVVYGTQDAAWERVDQPFWQRQVVFRVVANSDPRLYHRPSVAVGNEGRACLLTMNVQRVSRQRLLDCFNRIARKESLRIASENAASYARFFAVVHLLQQDSHCLVSGDLAARISGLSRASPELATLRETCDFRRTVEAAISLAENHFDAKVYRWNWKAAVVSEHRFTIHNNGTISFIGVRYSEQPD